jgi:hypothetical protein
MVSSIAFSFTTNSSLICDLLGMAPGARSEPQAFGSARFHAKQSFTRRRRARRGGAPCARKTVRLLQASCESVRQRDAGRCGCAHLPLPRWTSAVPQKSRSWLRGSARMYQSPRALSTSRASRPSGIGLFAPGWAIRAAYGTPSRRRAPSSVTLALQPCRFTLRTAASRMYDRRFSSVRSAAGRSSSSSREPINRSGSSSRKR